MPQHSSKQSVLRLPLTPLLLRPLAAANPQILWSAQTTPAHYRTGALITAIHSLNIADCTFDADLWVWTESSSTTGGSA